MNKSKKDEVTRSSPEVMQSDEDPEDTNMIMDNPEETEK